MTTKDLVEAAREYAKHDEYTVTRNYIIALCNEIDRLRTLNRDVFGRIQDNTEVYKNSERYQWLKNASWDVPQDVVAPAVVNCNGNMTEFQWLTGNELDTMIDKFMEEYK